MTKATLSPVLIGSADACKVLDVCRKTLTQLVRDNTVPHFRMGGRLKFSVTALEQWALQQSAVC